MYMLYNTDSPDNANALLQIITDIINNKEISEVGKKWGEKHLNSSTLANPMFLLFAIGLPVVLLFIGILAFAIYLLNYSQKNATNLTEEQIEKR
jgi:hypothetical protein